MCGLSDVAERLETAFADVTRKRVVVAVGPVGSEVTYAAVGGESEPADPGEWRFPTGCLTKLFTAALVDDAIRDRLLELHAPVAPLLGDALGIHELEHVTVRDLLEHTHGLDDAGIETAPLRDDGRIDAGRLMELLEPSAARTPRGLYSYSNAGPWLLASILERLHGQAFEAQLGRRLGAAGIAVERHAPSLVPARPKGLCPSMGATLAVSARAMVAFLDAEARRMRAGRPSREGGVGRITPLPGWNPLERGVYLGWKHHGEGWLGHNSVWPGASAMVRIEPSRSAVIVIASRDHPVPAVAAKLLADVLPELATTSFPKPLRPDEAAALDAAPFCGRYGSAPRTLTVRSLDGRTLRLRAPGVDTALVPARRNVFFARPAVPGRLSFVQFLHRRGGAFAHAWDGRCLFPRRDGD